MWCEWDSAAALPLLWDAVDAGPAEGAVPAWVLAVAPLLEEVTVPERDLAVALPAVVLPAAVDVWEEDERKVDVLEELPGATEDLRLSNSSSFVPIDSPYALSLPSNSVTDVQFL